MKRPKKWKMALLTWICVYPLINIISYTVIPYISDWHLLLRTLMITIILIPIMSVLMGVLQNKFGEWLFK